MEYIIREMKPEEYPLLADFLYEAIFQRDQSQLVPKSIIEKPELQVYIEQFGEKEHDHCLCAEAEGRIVGAVWTRVIDGYGHIGADIPEFAISLYREYRGMGIGTAMMEKMLDVLKRNGYRKASLAVQKDNYALRMYQNVGFYIIDENEEEYIMSYDFI